MLQTVLNTLGIGLMSLLLLSNCQSANQDPCQAIPITLQAPNQETDRLTQFIKSNHIQATADQRGFYYAIQKPGHGPKPTICSNVRVNYEGHLSNGTRFDQGKDVRFGLDQLIVGWQAGIPLIAPGGRITLYLPPLLAYGSQAQAAIPADSILIFQIDLLAIN